MSEKQTVPGFDIPIRELTEEEATRPLTLERFNEFHQEVGEDFVDQFGSINIHIFGGYILAKHPEWCVEILEICNDKYGEALSVEHLYVDKGLTEDDFYTDLAEFINLTVALKKRVNQVLIQVTEQFPGNKFDFLKLFF